MLTKVYRGALRARFGYFVRSQPIGFSVAISNVLAPQSGYMRYSLHSLKRCYMVSHTRLLDV